MILRQKTGDVVEKTVLVRNINEQDIDIKIFASGDLVNYTKIIDKEFRLKPGEEKNARFEIRVAKEGTTETKINIQFTPTIGKEGIGLSSTVIIVAEKGTNNIIEQYNEETNNTGTNKNTTITGNVTNKNASFNLSTIAIVIAIVLFVFLFLLIIFSKKGSNRGLEKETQKETQETKPKKRTKE